MHATQSMDFNNERVAGIGTKNGTIPTNGSSSNMNSSKTSIIEKSLSSSTSTNSMSSVGVGNGRLHQHFQQQSHHEAIKSTVKDHHHHYHSHHHHSIAKTSHHQNNNSSSSRHHIQQSTSASSSSSLFSSSHQKHHHHKSSSSLSSNMSSPLNSQHSKTTFRCIEDRIESARKLVKKLHKLCPFYEVSTNGDDAGRVYCRICDRYLGAVSSTLKNHINTQEHRQAYEDNHQTTLGLVAVPNGSYSGNIGGSSDVSTVGGTLSALHPPKTPSNGVPIGPLSSYSRNLATSSSREDLSIINGNDYSNGMNSKQQKQQPNPIQQGYSADGQQLKQLILKQGPGVGGCNLPPVSPVYMVQNSSTMAYNQQIIQSLENNRNQKYIDFDQLQLNNSGANDQNNNHNNTSDHQQLQQQQHSNWAQAAATTASAEVPIPQHSIHAHQHYLSFNNSNGRTISNNLNNLLSFTDAMMNGNSTPPPPPSSSSSSSSSASSSIVSSTMSIIGGTKQAGSGLHMQTTSMNGQNHINVLPTIPSHIPPSSHLLSPSLLSSSSSSHHQHQYPHYTIPSQGSNVANIGNNQTITTATTTMTQQQQQQNNSMPVMAYN